jgi:hypothetical protein
MPTPVPPAPTPVPAPSMSITNAHVLEAFSDGFTVQWTTSEASSSEVSFSDPSTGQSGVTVLDPTMETNHLVHVSGLNAGTIYNLRAISTSASGETVTSGQIQSATAQ